MKMIIYILIILMPFAGTSPDTGEKVESGIYRWADLRETEQKGQKILPVLEGKTTLLENFKVYVISLPVGGKAIRHKKHRDHEELIIAKEGSLTINLKSSAHTIGPGGVAVILPGDTHTLVNDGDSPAVCYVLEYEIPGEVDHQRGQSEGGSFIIDWEEASYREHNKGGRRDFYNRPTSAFRRFEMHVTTLNEGMKSHDPHTHKAEEIILVIEGDVEEQIGEKVYPGSAGDVIFLDSEVPHGIRNRGKGQCSYFAFQWD